MAGAYALPKFVTNGFNMRVWVILRLIYIFLVDDDMTETIL